MYQGSNFNTNWVTNNYVAPPPIIIEINAFFKDIDLSSDTDPKAIQLAVRTIEIKMVRIINTLSDKNIYVKKYPIIINWINILNIAYKEFFQSRYQECRIKISSPTGMKIINSRENGMNVIDSFIE